MFKGEGAKMKKKIIKGEDVDYGKLLLMLTGARAVEYVLLFVQQKL